MDYIAKLQEARKKAGYSQYDVAEKLNIPQPQISRYEQEKNELPIRYLIEFCRLYNVTPNWVLGWEE